MSRQVNRKLLVSVFNPQEAREAVLGGGRIIDSEDPRSALGNIKPRNIMSISSSVLGYRRNQEVQLSTNIGEDQLLFDRSERGLAIEKSPYEIAGKAAQAAIGVAYAMDTRVHPVNIIKVGVDGMQVDLAGEVLHEVVLTLRRTVQFANSQVMAVLFVQDLDLWEQRRTDDGVRNTLVGLREFFPAAEGDDGAFDLVDYAVGTLRGRDDKPLFTDPGQVDLGSLIDKEVLPHGTTSTHVRLNELFPHANFDLSSDASDRRTDEEVIKKMVDVAADAGADSIMLDTRIQTKASRISLLKLDSSPDLVDLAKYDKSGDGLPRAGVLTLKEIEFFVDYCHFRRIEANLAGSLQSYHAQQLWRLVPETDQMSTRGGSTAVVVNPAGGQGQDTRRDRATDRNLVRGLVAPEQGGCLNIPVSMKGVPSAEADIRVLLQKYPDLETFWVSPLGIQTPFNN